ncbi:MAG: hypothetical protein IPO32_01180 [Crocinitomicaceae bacterium]|nr:hypothetical protein [Crocinitomicaceae bacterium]
MRILFLVRLALFILILCWIWLENNSMKVNDDSPEYNALSFKEEAIDMSELLSRKCCASRNTVQLERDKFRDY